MAKQTGEDVYREKSDSVIDNSGSIDDTRIQLKEILE
jgi:dephospho-CoA kinase